MRRLIYISHANVSVEPDKPVPRWSLSPEGRRRHATFADSALARSVQAVYASDETKALEAADWMFPSFAGRIRVRADLGENDRSATGYLPPAEFEAVADRFFAQATISVRGWERAVDAQRRVVSAVTAALAKTPEGHTLAIVGHGGVGTLLYCHWAGLAIGRRYDQPSNGGGNVLIADTGEDAVISGWTPMESYR